jgi:hypothetical protein
MADYIKSTDFAIKDGLTTGDPNKIIKGTEINTELNDISTAIASKADTNSPVFTGNPTAPTQAFGNNTTRISTTAFVQAALVALYPVGTIYSSVVGTNPATLFGFGTWVAFGAGRVVVGFNAGDSLFNASEKIGGSKDAIVVAHTHTGTTSTIGDHVHNLSVFNSGGGPFTERAQGTFGGFTQTLTATTQNAGAHNHSFTTNSTGSSGTNANIQPYITVYMWKRTA